MNIKPLRKDLLEYIEVHHLQKKVEKALRLFEIDIRHPSLLTELLEPHWRGIYSFRLDNKYRALFFLTANGEAEVFRITNHYKK
jgi:plasmid maintenance system killer protein